MVSELLYPADNLQLFVRLSLAILVGSIIGAEREFQSKSAGLRTNILVCFGSALIVLIPIQLGIAQVSADGFMRSISGVASGIGFIGAGTILQGSKKNVRGLTSAAAIWMSAALGMTIACGLLGLGVICAIVTWVVLQVLVKLEKRWMTTHQRKRTKSR